MTNYWFFATASTFLGMWLKPEIKFMLILSHIIHRPRTHIYSTHRTGDFVSQILPMINPNFQTFNMEIISTLLPTISQGLILFQFLLTDRTDGFFVNDLSQLVLLWLYMYSFSFLFPTSQIIFLFLIFLLLKFTTQNILDFLIHIWSLIDYGWFLIDSEFF
jgi:hypothetical protein